MKQASGNSRKTPLEKVLHIRYNHFPFACSVVVFVYGCIAIVRFVRHRDADLIEKESRMNKSMIAAGLLVVMSLAVPAMACPGGGECGGRQSMNGMQRMAQDLNLSDAQQKKIKQIRTDTHATMKAMREDMMANRDAMQRLDPSAADFTARSDKLAVEKGALVEGMMKVRAATQAEISAILTPEQRVKHLQLHKQRQEERKKRQAGRRGNWDKGRGGPGGDGGPRGMGM